MNTLELIARDAPDVPTALSLLHEAGATPIAAIQALRSGRQLSLPKAKTALSRSPSWAAETAAADRLHEELERIFSE